MELREYRQTDLARRGKKITARVERDLAQRQSLAMQDRGIYGGLVSPMSYAIYNDRSKLTFVNSRFAKTLYDGDSSYD
jgi:hypothetical protein